MKAATIGKLFRSDIAVFFELLREVALVIEADICGYLRERLFALDQQLLGSFYPLS